MERIERNRMDFNELWLDPDISGEYLVAIDPLDITIEMVEAAEHPEYANLDLYRVPECALSDRVARRLWSRTRDLLRARHGHESADEFLARLAGSDLSLIHI